MERRGVGQAASGTATKSRQPAASAKRSGFKNAAPHRDHGCRSREITVEGGVRPGAHRQSRGGGQNYNHLLNFQFPSRDPGSYSHHGRRQPITRLFNKEQYLQANCQFVVCENGDYGKHAVCPDTLVDWTLIEQVRLLSHGVANCPICLHPPVAAKITRCGHVYCWSCILHYLALGERSWRKCPICYEAVHSSDLKSVVAINKHQYHPGEKVTMTLMKRQRGSCYAMPASQWTDRQGKPHHLGDAVDTNYVKLLVASREQIQSLLDAERCALECQLADDGGEPSTTTTTAGEPSTTTTTTAANSATSTTAHSSGGGGHVEADANVHGERFEPSERCFIEVALDLLAKREHGLRKSMSAEAGGIGAFAAIAAAGGVGLAGGGRGRTMSCVSGETCSSADSAEYPQRPPASNPDVVYTDAFNDVFIRPAPTPATVTGRAQREPLMAGVSPHSPQDSIGQDLSSAESSDSGIQRSFSEADIEALRQQRKIPSPTKDTLSALPLLEVLDPSSCAQQTNTACSPASVAAPMADVQTSSDSEGHEGHVGHAVQSHDQQATDDKTASRGMQPTAKESDMYYFYQASDAQHMFIHWLNVRCLVYEYGGLARCPQTITATIVQVESFTMTEEYRQKFRYLSHLPLSCQFTIAELALKPPFLSPHTLRHFSDEINRRRAIRQGKEREEKRRQRKLEREAAREKELRPTMVASLQAHIDSLQLNNDSGSVTVRENSIAEAVHSGSAWSSPPPGQGDTQNDEIDNDDSFDTSPTLSFAQMLRQGKRRPADLHGQIGGEQCHHNAERTRRSDLHDAGTSLELSPGCEADTDAALEYQCPRYSDTFGAALQHALEGIGKETSTSSPAARPATTQPTTGGGGSRKKRRKGNKKLLFTTSLTLPSK